MTETAFANELLKWCRVFGWRAFHVRNSGYGGNTYVQGDKGFPDLILVRDDDWIVAELKIGKAGTKRSQPKPEQQAWLAALQRIGARAYVWRPEDMPAILAALAR